MLIDTLLEFSNRRELRQWLEENHRTASHAWVVCNRNKANKDGLIPYLEVVEECLCFGWIDSTLKRLPDGRHAQRISPRRKGSHWTELNKQRCQQLEEQGLMTEAGREALNISLLSN